MNKDKKELLSGFITGVIGMLIVFVLWGWFRNHQMERRNERIVETINNHTPIYGAGYRLDSVAFLPSSRLYFLPNSDGEVVFFMGIQADIACPQSLLAGFGLETMLYSVLTPREREFFLNNNSSIRSQVFEIMIIE